LRLPGQRLRFARAGEKWQDVLKKPEEANKMISTIQTVNPATGETIASYQVASDPEIDRILGRARSGFERWRREPLSAREAAMRQAATTLRRQKSELGRLVSLEMGKPVTQSEAEVEKCAWNCDFYAQNAAALLARRPISSGATESYVEFIPLGVILAIMPWNFPFWQVFRFAAPSLMAGNTAVLKHASNVSGCSLAIAEIFKDSGFPDGIFQSVIVPGAGVSRMIEDERIAAVTLTGSDVVGSQVAARAGSVIKKTIMELGGSDPYIVLADADLDTAASVGVRARFQNTGQSCIAAKRFIIEERVFDDFCDRFVRLVKALKVGDPLDRACEVGPLARADLRDTLQQQVQASVSQGARTLVGGATMSGRGFFFTPTVLTDVTAEMVAGREEVFGPVAAMMKAASPEEAIAIANATSFGLGASLWTSDLDKARRLAESIEAGQVFVNGMVASDPRLPFGGIKRSGYGRELSEFGIREFVNIQTVWIGPGR
jgi:acyl-CoA reductase-like NAD-dependent aldehyde dehydrogenase